MVNLKVISISISMLVILLLSTTSYAQTIDDYYTIDFGFQYRDIGVKDFLNPVGPECGLSYHFRRDHLDIVPHMKLFTSFAEYKISDSKEIGGSGIGFDLGFCIDWYFYKSIF